MRISKNYARRIFNGLVSPNDRTVYVIHFTNLECDTCLSKLILTMRASEEYSEVEDLKFYTFDHRDDPELFKRLYPQINTQEHGGVIALIVINKNVRETLKLFSKEILNKLPEYIEGNFTIPRSSEGAFKMEKDQKIMEIAYKTFQDFIEKEIV